MNSDLPEPVIPAINPCGPWAFSCKSNLNNSRDLSKPTGACNVLVGSLFFHLFKIFSCSTIPTLYISRKVTLFGKLWCSFSMSIGILARNLQHSYIFIVASISATNSFCLFDTSSFSNIPDFLSPILINVLHSFGMFTSRGLTTIKLKPTFISKPATSLTISTSLTSL